MRVQLLAEQRDRQQHGDGRIQRSNGSDRGDWGEWHVMWSHYKWPSPERKRAVLSRIIETYIDVFAPGATNASQLSLAQVYDDDCGGETPLKEAIWHQALDVAQTSGLSFSRHGFIDGFGGWPNDFMDAYRATNPMLAEANWSYDQIKDDKPHGTMREHVDAYAHWHSTWAHQYLRSGSFRRAMKLGRTGLERALQPGGISYRFALMSASWPQSHAPGGRFVIQQTWTNANTAVCPLPLVLKFSVTTPRGEDISSVTNRSFDFRSLVRGEARPHETPPLLPSSLCPATYDLRVTLLDESSGTNDSLANFRETLFGGDAATGRKLFFERVDASCLRCHKVGWEGGDVGPNLTGLGKKQPREYLLESIVSPNAKIATGFESVTLTMKNGATHAGAVKQETAEWLELNSPEDGFLQLAKKDIAERQRGLSGMPEGFGQTLSKRDLRDLVEFLANLK